MALTLTGPGSAEVPGTAGYDAPTGKVTFTPAAPLAAATTYTATLTATSATGQQLRRRHVDVHDRSGPAARRRVPLLAVPGLRDSRRTGIQ